MATPHSTASPGPALHGGDHHDDGHPHEHISPLSMYFGVFGALLVLTVITVWVSTLGLGPIAIYVAMFVAIIKAFMVCAYFMHLKWDSPFNRLVFISSIVFMAIFFVITATDLGYRGQINPETDTMVLRQEENATAAEAARKAAFEAKTVVLARAPGSVPTGVDNPPAAVPAAAAPAPAAPAAPAVAPAAPAAAPAAPAAP
ncbi:MAG: cytochrome C oxidase subunit IV family protein [Myxococcales bacterium]|nr:cytochrome C oxidase subunit IV family protein [Myxococcales bacterium]